MHIDGVAYAPSESPEMHFGTSSCLLCGKKEIRYESTSASTKQLKFVLHIETL